MCDVTGWFAGERALLACDIDRGLGHEVIPCRMFRVENEDDHVLLDTDLCGRIAPRLNVMWVQFVFVPSDSNSVHAGKNGQLPCEQNV